MVRPFPGTRNLESPAPDPEPSGTGDRNRQTVPRAIAGPTPAGISEAPRTTEPWYAPLAPPDHPGGASTRRIPVRYGAYGTVLRGRIAQLVRASVLQTEGRWFESGCAHCTALAAHLAGRAVSARQKGSRAVARDPLLVPPGSGCPRFAHRSRVSAERFWLGPGRVFPGQVRRKGALDALEGDLRSRCRTDRGGVGGSPPGVGRVSLAARCFSARSSRDVPESVQAEPACGALCPAWIHPQPPP